MTDATRIYSLPSRRELAPGELELLQAFVNTHDLESGREELRSADTLRAWLVERGLLPDTAPVTEPDRRRAVELREGLRELAAVNSDDRPDTARFAAFEAALGELPIVARLGAGGEWRLEPSRPGTIDGFLQRIVAIAARAMADGSWTRVKICRNHGCRWLFYDHSRNRSSTWCTMAVCGSREKARAYRARQRAGAD